MDYPKEYRENLEWRRTLLTRCQKDLVFREQVKELFYRDPIFAFNAFFYTLDVRRKPEHHQPFCTYKYQDDAILEMVKCIKAGEDIGLEKTRDMGASWMVLLIFLWFWLDPKGGSDFLLGSRIEDYVDKKGDMRALLPKVRYAFYKLPKWLWPKEFSSKTHDNFMRLQNPDTGSSITGESNNANFSTGGRYTAILFDEQAKWEGTDKSAWTAAGDATPCRIPVSTPFGAAGQYYAYVTDSTKRKIRLHWSLHPRKADGAYCFWPRRQEDLEDWNEDVGNGESYERFIRSPWYDRECARRSPLEIAQELDIDYIGAGNPVFDGKAGKRIGVLLKIERKPVGYKDFNLGELKLVSVGEDNIRDSEGLLIVFREPKPTASYAIGVDVVEGVEGGDYATVKVVNRTTKDVDATYYSRINEVDLARIIKCVAEYYTTYEAPWVGVETNAAGLSTFDFCDTVHNIPNLFMMPVFDSAKESVSWKKGWRTTASSRNILIAGIKDWLLDKRGWADPRLCREFTTFIKYPTGKAAAKAGANDDEVMAFGIALQVDLIAPFVEQEKEMKRDGTLGLVSFPFEPTSERVKTIEELCFDSAVRKVEERKDLTMFGITQATHNQFDEGWNY